MFAPGVTVLMIALEFLEVGFSTINKAAMNKGMSQFVFTLYANALGFLFLLVSSFLFYRKRICSPLTFPITCKIFLLGLIGCCVQLSLNTGIKLSSPTLSRAMTDLTPAFTFLLALITRMEKLNLRVRSSQAKSIGTLVSIVGALIVTLYNDQPIKCGTCQKKNALHHLLLPSQSNWVVGGVFCVAGAACLALQYNVQTWILKDFPEEMIITLISTFSVATLSAIVSIIAEKKDPDAWKLTTNIELIAIVASAAFGVSLRSVVHSWACRKKGPVYTSMFKPLGIAIAMMLGVSFLGDALYLGRVIGAVIISLGFYAVIWGKAQEEKQANSSLEESPSKAPLLDTKNEV